MSGPSCSFVLFQTLGSYITVLSLKTKAGQGFCDAGQGSPPGLCAKGPAQFWPVRLIPFQCAQACCACVLSRFCMLDITLMSCDENAGSWAGGSTGSPFITLMAPSPAVKLLAEAQSPSVQRLRGSLPISIGLVVNQDWKAAQRSPGKRWLSYPSICVKGGVHRISTSGSESFRIQTETFCLH